MSLVGRAQKDWRRHTTSEQGAGVTLLFTTKDGTISSEVRGLGMSHHLKFDTDGQAVNSRNSHITVSEQELTEQGYPVRVSGEVSLYEHKVTFTGSENIEREFLIIQSFPDETTGVITCILSVNE